MNLENSKLQEGIIAYKLDIEQLEYINDSIIEDLNNTRKELKIKDKEIKVNPKYFRDLIVYVRLLFLSQEYKKKDKYNILNEWHKITRLRKIDLSEYSGSLSNKILLRLLVKQYYSLVNILVNWRKLLS